MKFLSNSVVLEIECKGTEFLYGRVSQLWGILYTIGVV